MSGECDKCGEHALECSCSLDGAVLTKRAYEKHGLKYSIYEGNNRFYGTPVPEGYEAVYLDDGFCPPSLQLKKQEM